MKVKYLLLYLVFTAYVFVAYTHPISESILQKNTVMEIEENVVEETQEKTVEKDISKIKIANMAKDVEVLWQLLFDDNNFKQKDTRREKFKEYSMYLANSVYTYQNYTDVRAKLPRHKTTHIIVGAMAFVESKLDSKAVGARGEVGLLQIHKTALAGHDPKQVKENAELGLLLGTRWLASNISLCYDNNIDDWKIDMWSGPLSIYTAGMNGFNIEKRRCKKLIVAKKRVNIAKQYLPRILAFKEIENI